jgi:glycosyltransferase involved in cell wall biosynthesis
LFFSWRSRAQFLSFSELPLDLSGPEIDHVVVIPARNEAAVIQRVVRSLAGSPVLVVDDHSTDETFALARDAGAHVVEAEALPRLWLGKPNACWTGAQRTESKWILFVDADTWFEPGFVKSLLNYAEKNDLEAATCFPQQEYGSLVERMVMPYAFGLYFTGVNARDVNNPLKREALANGQCLLMRRDAYNFIGGHRSVATSVIEDVAIARRIKQHRMRSHVLRAGNLARVRMYDSFAALRRGFEKNSFRFLQANPRTGVMVVLASIVMTSWLPALLWLLVEGAWPAALGFALVPAVGWARWYGGVLRPLSAPVAIYLFQVVVLSGMFKTILGLPTRWKDRRVG